MPPRLPLTLHRPQHLTTEPYVCLSCLSKVGPRVKGPRIEPASRHGASYAREDPIRFARRIRPLERKGQHIPESIRRPASNSSLASSTAINAPTSVPQAYRELYQALLALQETASSYVDRSRLQLATRSLESDDPVLRIALLGLGSNGPLAARKLAKVLLSDALSEEQTWEHELLQSMGDGRSLLIRYGDAEDTTQSNPLVQTLRVPSLFLQRHNVEILITTTNAAADAASDSDHAALEDSLLVPPLSTPTSAQGRVGFVRYPVHKAVIVAEGVTGAVEYGRFPTTPSKNGLINAALNVPLRSDAGDRSAESQLNSKAVDVDLAQHALDLFRSDKANGAKFSEEWQRSHVGSIANCITGGRRETLDSALDPTVRGLIRSLLANASSSMSVVEDKERNLATANTISDPRRTTLQSAISTWSAEAHKDLQTNLDTAFRDSRSWHRTVWWRLFWRIDDVTVSASDVLRNYWLTEAERNLAFLSGRIFDSGLANEEQLNGISAMSLEEVATDDQNEAQSGSTTVAELTQRPSTLRMLREKGLINTTFDQPWPQTIALSRQYILQTLIPDLHRKAQGLLLTSLTTIGGSVALGAWFFAATAGHGLYESGAVVALGLVLGLRRLQRKWSKERDDFAVAVRENARGVLAETENQLRKLIRDGGRVSVRPEDERGWREAREAVESCRLALEKVQSSA